MTAGTSVLGLYNNGEGSVDGKNKGSARQTLGVNHLIGPRVVAAGQTAMATSAATTTFVAFPTLADAVTEYVAIVTPVNFNLGATALQATTIAADGLTVTHAANSTSDQYFNWVIVHI